MKQEWTPEQLAHRKEVIDEIVAAKDRGESYVSIGKRLGLSRERVSQIHRAELRRREYQDERDRG